MAQDNDLLLGLVPAAHRLGVGRTTLISLLKGNPPAIKSVRIGRRRLVPMAALEDYVRKLEAQTQG
jgi:excisionase family DNA binding protein